MRLVGTRSSCQIRQNMSTGKAECSSNDLYIGCSPSYTEASSRSQSSLLLAYTSWLDWIAMLFRYPPQRADNRSSGDPAATPPTRLALRSDFRQAQMASPSPRVSGLPFPAGPRRAT